MKLFAAWAMATGVLAMVPAAQAQMPAPYVVEVSPYAVVRGPDDVYAMPPEEMPPRPAPRAYYAPPVLPSRAVYDIVRESGFSPLSAPRHRGPVYVISVINPDGEDGRLVIDARTGRIRHFTPAYRMGERFRDDLTVTTYGRGGPPPPADLRRPPARVPHVASLPHGATAPKAAPQRAEKTGPAPSQPVAAKPVTKPAQQSASTQSQSTTVGAARATESKPAAPASTEMKPSTPQILPTQEMPAVQGLD
jgi:hypothetical protein